MYDDDIKSNGEYQEFKTNEDAEDWLKEDDYEGISEEECGNSFYLEKEN